MFRNIGHEFFVKNELLASIECLRSCIELLVNELHLILNKKKNEAIDSSILLSNEDRTISKINKDIDFCKEVLMKCTE